MTIVQQGGSAVIPNCFFSNSYMYVKKMSEALKVNSPWKSGENTCQQCDNKTGSIQGHFLLHLGQS